MNFLSFAFTKAQAVYTKSSLLMAATFPSIAARHFYVVNILP
jgi:hypothetical protein